MDELEKISAVVQTAHAEDDISVWIEQQQGAFLNLDLESLDDDVPLLIKMICDRKDTAWFDKK